MAPKRKIKPIKRKILRRRKDRNTFEYAISLGSFCLTARFLEGHGLREFKCPFDWGFSSPRIVRHCIKDDFKAFLDLRRLCCQGSGTGHSLYVNMLHMSKAKVLWPHHQCFTKNDHHASFKRAVGRMRSVFDCKHARSLFLLAVSVDTVAMLDSVREKGPKHLPSRCSISSLEDVTDSSSLASVEEVRQLYRDLARRVKGSFHFDVVYVVQPPASEAVRKVLCKKIHSESTGQSALVVHELHCRGKNSGLFFKDKDDANALHTLVVKGRSFNLTKVDDSRPVGMSDNLRKRAKRLRPKHAVSHSKGSTKTLGSKMKAKLRSKLSALQARGGLNRSIEVVKENPKMPGSSAHERYEQYKVAKTVKQFYDLGGCSGDLSHDTARGYIKFR